MGWHNYKFPGHEGYVRAVVLTARGLYRELGIDDLHEQLIGELQIGCDCGWRSMRVVAPFGTRYCPSVVLFPAHDAERFEERARKLWHSLHLDQLHAEDVLLGRGFTESGRLLTTRKLEED